MANVNRKRRLPDAFNPSSPNGGSLQQNRYAEETGFKTVPSADGSEFLSLFYGTATPLSNFHRSVFVLDGVRFVNTEQYFHYKKAELFNDEQMMAAILATENPGEQKKCGRRVKNYDEARWNDVCVEVMKQGCLAKFVQNQSLRKRLFETRGSRLVEASPRDRKWGIGLGINHANVANPSCWTGQNLLGKVLTEVREALLKDPRFSNEAFSCKTLTS